MEQRNRTLLEEGARELPPAERERWKKRVEQIEPVQSGGWSKSPPSQAWCYQEFKPREDRFKYSVHCHRSQDSCKQAKAGSSTATECVYLAAIPRELWNPAPKGWMDSWFQYVERPLPAPFPQLSADLSNPDHLRK